VLRKRLLLLFGCLVTLFLVLGVGVVMLLQGVVGQLHAVSTDGMSGVSVVSAMQLSVGNFRREVERADELDQPVPISRWKFLAETVTEDAAALGAIGDIGPEAEAERNGLSTLVEELLVLEPALVGDDSATSKPARQGAITAAIKQLDTVRTRLDALQVALRGHNQAKLDAAVGGLQTLALWLGIGFVLVINVSVVFLSGIAGMILKPIDRLVDASRRLAREEFDHRVELSGRDEFSELARAYNSLAEQLQANEQRKIETLLQVARTLNHELNNAIAIIQFQLALVARGTGAGALETGRLREIQQALSRMAATVSALTRVRRIVLTDYLSGVKMLDLEASVAETAPSEVHPESLPGVPDPALGPVTVEVTKGVTLGAPSSAPGSVHNSDHDVP
jgi:methyl-accepting chemotaxis protein